MSYYTPLTSDGSPLRLPVQFLGYRCNFVWPLHEQASRTQHLLKLIGIVVSLCCYVATILAEISYMSENSHDIPALAQCLTTTLMGMQYSVRLFVLYLRQRQMRALLKHFYRHIYFKPSDDPQLYGEIAVITRFVNYGTKIYYIPLMMIVGMFVADVLQQGLHSATKPFIYAMSFRWYDAQSPVLYILTALYTGWLSPSCVSLMAAEDYMLCVMLCHTSYRYKQLQRELANMYDDGARKEQHVFRARLYGILRREQKLQCFVVQAKRHFTHQIFYCLTFGVLSLCVVTFQLQRTRIGIDWIKYIFWLSSHFAQFVMIGYFGQMLKDESSSMQNSYYMCQWEQLLAHSGSSQLNKNLMLDIQFAILNTANTAAELEGMKMFALNHHTVGSAVRTAVSYFMFLNTMNDANAK